MEDPKTTLPEMLLLLLSHFRQCRRFFASFGITVVLLMKEERCNVAVYEPQLQMGLRTCEFTRGHTSVKYFVTLDTLMKKISSLPTGNSTEEALSLDFNPEPLNFEG